MVIRLTSDIPEEGYRLYANNRQKAEEYIVLGYKACFINGTDLCFLPENICSPLTEEYFERIKAAENHDIFRVARDGRVTRVFESASVDNTLMVTGLCNSNCIMCPAHDNLRRNAQSMLVSSAVAMIDYMPEDTEHITITGGEPFMLKEGIFDIFAELKEKLPWTSYLLLTNGRALSNRYYFEKFKETIPEKVLLGIPVHGHDSRTHDYITRAEGSFEQTRIAIKKLIRAGYDVEIRLVISKLNEDDITAIGHLIGNEFAKARTVKFMGLEMMGNAVVNQEKVWIPYREAFIKSKEAIDYLISKQIEVGLYNFPLCAVDPAYHLLCKKSISGYKVRFPEGCDRCKMKDACGGFFASSLRLGQKDIVPYA